MTVIAWDGKTLAADRRCTNYGLIYESRKIERIDDDTFVGVHGTMCVGKELIAWFRAGADPKLHQKQEKDEATYLFIVRRDGRISRVESNGFECPVEGMPFFAEGSGRDFAIAAMALGKNAREAVELTSRFSSHCGNGVDVLTFEEAR